MNKSGLTKSKFLNPGYTFRWFKIHIWFYIRYSGTLMLGPRMSRLKAREE